MSRCLGIYWIGAAFIFSTVATVDGPVEKSRTAAENFRKVAVSGDGDGDRQVNREYIALVKAFTANDDVEDFEFDSSLTIAAMAHWYSICAQLGDRNNIEDFRELRGSLVGSFVGRIEGRLKTRAPDFWRESLSSFKFYMNFDDEEMPYRFNSTTADEELVKLDDEEYGVAIPMTARVTPYARELGLGPDDGNLFFQAKKNELVTPDISDIRLDAEQTENGDKYLLLYSVDGSPVYYLRHPKTAREARRLVYDIYGMPLQFNLFDISVSGDKVIVWGVTPASCFFTVHDAGDLSVLESFYTQF